MEEGLIPDLAPNLYSQGQVGTGYAQVFDLGAPNPFDVTQDYINQTVANKKEAVKKAVANEEKRQQKLDDFLASIDDLDQPWNVAKVELGKKIDDYGELISSMRAQGTPIKSGELTKAQKELKELSKVNNVNYQKAMKINVEMQDPLIYTDEERDAFDKEIKKAADQKDASGNPIDGGIYEVQKVLDKWQKGVETPSIVSDFTKTFRPPAKDMKGKEKATLQKDFEQAVSDQFDSYNNSQLKKLLKSYQESGKIDDLYTMDQIDDEDPTVLSAIKDQMTKDLEPYKEFDKIQGSGRSSYHTSTDNKKLDGVSFYNHYNFKEGYLHGAKIQTTKSTEFTDMDGNKVTLIPSTIVSGDITADKKGWALTGREVAQRGSRYDTEQEAKDSNPGELVEYEDATGKYVVVKQGKNTTVPLTQENLAALEAMGFKDIMNFWKAEYVKAGGSGKWFDEETSKTFGYGSTIDMN